MTVDHKGAHRKRARSCRTCRRVLFPQQDGTLPPHKKPAVKGKGRFGQPLTGRDAEWCRGGEGADRG